MLSICGNGIDRVEEVAPVPEARGDQHPAQPDAQRPQPVLATGQERDPDGEHAQRRQQGDLRPDAQAGRQRAEEERARPHAGEHARVARDRDLGDDALLGVVLVRLGVEARGPVLGEGRHIPIGRRLGRTGYSRRRPGRGGAVDQEGQHRQQEEDPHDVVGRVAGLRADQHLRVEHDCGAEQGGGADRIGAADAPRRQQRHRQPAEVDQGRQRVVVERDHRDRVQKLRVLRVEPGSQLERIGEVQRPHLAGLREPPREGHVVPGGVLVVHAGVERLLGRLGPVRDNQRSGRDRHQGHRQAGLDRRELVVLGADVASPGPVGGPQPNGNARQQQRHLLEQLQQAQQLRDHDQGRDPEHELRETGERACPRGNEQGSHVVGA